MTLQEGREAVQEMLKERDPEAVATAFVRMYVDGKIEFEDLRFFVDECGFDITDEFLEMSDEERKKRFKELDEEDVEEEVIEEESEDKKEEEERASKEEDYNGEKVYDKKGHPTVSAEEEKEETEEEKAEKLYNLKF